MATLATVRAPRCYPAGGGRSRRRDQRVFRACRRTVGRGVSHNGKARVESNFRCLVGGAAPARVCDHPPVPVDIGGLAWQSGAAASTGEEQEAKNMKYMLLVYGDEQASDEVEKERCYQESARMAHQIRATGQYLAAAPLHPIASATSVRVRDGKRLVTDGPFAETREQLGGPVLL